MKFHRGRGIKDFSINQALRDHLTKTGVDLHNVQQRRTFAKCVNVPEKTLLEVFQDKKQIGPQLQARLFVATKDSCFTPRNQLEKTALADWRANPTPPTTVITVGEKAPALSPQPTNPDYLYDCLDQLWQKYSIGRKKDRRALLVEKHSQMCKSLWRGLLTRREPFTASKKIRIYLTFVDPAFAPLDSNEKHIYESWKKEIPNPLPFVECVDQLAAAASPTMPTSPTTTPPSLLDKSAFLQDPTFLFALARAIKPYLGLEITTLETVINFPDGEAIPASFVQETADLLQQVISKLKTIAAMSTSQRQNVQIELNRLFEQLETVLAECFLLARALAHTNTREAVSKMLRGERGFMDKLRQSGLTDKQ